jgi:hypothetical protein
MYRRSDILNQQLAFHERIVIHGTDFITGSDSFTISTFGGDGFVMDRAICQMQKESHRCWIRRVVGYNIILIR